MYSPVGMKMKPRDAPVLSLKHPAGSRWLPDLKVAPGKENEVTVLGQVKNTKSGGGHSVSQSI